MSIEQASRLYKALAEKYRSKNINQSWLCYENALYYNRKESHQQEQICAAKEDEANHRENELFCAECKREMRAIEQQPAFAVVKTAIVLLSYNQGELTKDCIESIRQNNSPETYELIVVDNASSDGIQEWLRVQKDMKLIENPVNQGFPYGCNQGIGQAEETSNILLLNNDTLVPENAIFWLRMGLYEKDNIGAVGSISNNVVNYQQVSQQFETVKEWMEFARENNVPMEYPYEKKSWLVGFAMLLKRTALEAVLNQEPDAARADPKEILDTRFSPGNFEDNDLSIRLLLAGYQLQLVKNSFIFHYGSMAFLKMPVQYKNLLEKNKKKLEEKYGMDLISGSVLEMALVDMIKPEKKIFRVLEIGCKLGTTLARIESFYPQAEVLGIEKNELLARLAKEVIDVIPGDFLEKTSAEICQACGAQTDLSGRLFDYIILNQVLAGQAVQLLEKAKECLEAEGSILIMVANAQCIRVIDTDQRSAGFTLEEITELCNFCRLKIQRFHYRSVVLSAEEKQKILQLCGNWDNPLRPLYEAEKFIFEVKKS